MVYPGVLHQVGVSLQVCCIVSFHTQVLWGVDFMSTKDSRETNCSKQIVPNLLRISHFLCVLFDNLNKAYNKRKK